MCISRVACVTACVCSDVRTLGSAEGGESASDWITRMRNIQEEKKKAEKKVNDMYMHVHVAAVYMYMYVTEHQSSVLINVSLYTCMLNALSVLAINAPHAGFL